MKFINGTGFAPQAATIDFYKSKGGLPDQGPLSIAVPGAVGGAAFALKKYGTKPLADVLAPAIEIAEQGFPITETLAGQLASGRDEAREMAVDDEDLVQGREAAADGRHPGEPGAGEDAARDRRRRARMSSTSGEVAKNTAAFLKKSGGIITEADLRSYEPFEDTPVRTNYRGTDVYECPPNSQGFLMLEALNILEGFDLQARWGTTARPTCTR